MDNTIEEAAETIRQKSFMCCSLSKSIDYITVGEREKSAFIRGVEWQQERSYNEEEVENIVNKTVDKFCTFFSDDLKQKVAKEWFETIKKK